MWQKCVKPECALIHGRRMIQKQKDAEHAKLKKKVKTNDRQHQIDLTQDVFNRLRKLQELKWFADRGLEPTCISCGKPKGDDVWSCGHLRTRKAAKQLSFDPLNTYLQHNKNCNYEKSGDVENYKLGLIKRFGEIEGQRIIDYVETNNSLASWTCDELIQMRKEFNKEIRSLNAE
jgi:hypothetical protein